MFLLRSAFWLTVMFIIIAPKGVDLGKTASDYSRQALDMGQKAIVTQALAGDCHSLECAGGKAAIAILAGNATTLVGNTSPKPSILVPLPRPRPDRPS